MFTRTAWGLALLIGAGSALAQDGPAEVPPVSFIGTQYVDSAGCVYVRAGVGDTVVWVPRVTAARQPVCGQTPTMQTLPVAEVAVAPVETAAPADVAEVVVVAPPKPAHKATRVQVVRPAKAPAVVVRRVPAPGTVLREDEIPAGVRVVPRHVYEQQRAAAVRVTVPEGYRNAFDDDRLNLRRAEMNAAGIAATNRVFTRTVPREIIVRPYEEQKTGGYVTVRVPVVSTQGRAGQATPSAHDLR
ncbi:hypothetical protein [Pseudooceanicola sp. LIPI14-2-Ac024]|uniref:hypothetical protein n=1 Tax=Pseudooceanicola sp. LIPI14-2-Ac024 TaxID=3344875 RepID=UPI0035CF354E